MTEQEPEEKRLTLKNVLHELASTVGREDLMEHIENLGEHERDDERKRDDEMTDEERASAPDVKPEEAGPQEENGKSTITDVPVVAQVPGTSDEPAEAPEGEPRL